MALGRLVDITIGPGNGVSVVSGYMTTQVSELDCSFNIVRSVTPSENKCNVKIYNMTADSRNRILQENNNLIIKAGYADENNLGLIFSGNIDEIVTKREGPDIVSEISATSYRGKDKNIDSIWVSYTYDKDLPFSTVVTEVASNMGLAVLGAENLTGIKLANGFNVAGSFRSALAYIQKIGYAHKIAMYIDGTVLYIFRIGLPTRVSTVVLEYGGSLLSIEQTKQSKHQKKLEYKNAKTKKELTVECLLDPKIIPSESLFIKDPVHEGAYFIKEVNFYGDNFAGDFNCTIKVESID